MAKRKRYYLEDGYYDPQIRATVLPIARRGYSVVETGFEKAFGLDLTQILWQIVIVEGLYIGVSLIWRATRFVNTSLNWFSNTGGLYAEYETPIGRQTLLAIVGDALGFKRVSEPTKNPSLTPEIVLDKILIDYFMYVVLTIPIIIVLLNWWSKKQKEKRLRGMVVV